MSRKARIFQHGLFAGVLEEVLTGDFVFQYDEKYLDDADSQAVSLTLPLQKDAFYSNKMFGFFDGLIPEGWLLEIFAKNWKISQDDRMGLLLTCCRDCIGSVHVLPFGEEND